MRLLFLFIILLTFTRQLPAADFGFYQKQGPHSGPTLLVIGGVDGDEPGGFHAAAMLVTRYKIHEGSLWIVPNLNAKAILERRRGDMNLKFDFLSENDPQYEIIKRIKSIITQPQVDLVLNLHDGSGFYHPSRISSEKNQYKWGQCCVIDQKELPETRFGNLQHLAETGIRRINAQALSADQHFHLKNVKTGTARADIPTKKSLSFFAVRNNKPALAIEASKSHPVQVRVYYHLLALESFMQQMGIGFSRDFDLTPDGVSQAIRNDARLSLADGRIQLELNNLRDTLRYFPLPKSGGPEMAAMNPLVTLLPNDNRYRIHYGNNRLAVLDPQFFELDQSIENVEMQIDGVSQSVPFGSILPVEKDFQVNNQEGYRVNVIGFTRQGNGRSDAHVRISRNQLDRHHSIDKAGLLYRVEVYRDERFSGMVLVDFRPGSRKKEPLMAHSAATETAAGEKNN